MTDSSKKCTILVVDDDTTQLSLIAQILRNDKNYTVITSENGNDALHLAELHAPQIIISDYYMPGMDGFAFCKKIKEHPLLREGMFILLTAATSVDDKVKGLDSGADEFISKPVYPEELLSRVRASFRTVKLQEDLKAEKRKLAETNIILEESYSGMLNLLTMLIGIHVPGAAKRAERALKIVEWIGAKLSLPQESMQALSSAAALHEIGKIAIFDPLTEEGKNVADQKERIQYPLAGESLLSKIPKLQEVTVLIRHQMENYDGSGFPDKLMGEEIPIGSRILRAVNFIEHNNDKFPTKESLLDAIKRNRSSILDPAITQLLEEFLLSIEEKDWLIGKKAVSVNDLIPGMKLAADLSTGSGTKLLTKDTVMSQHHIERILSHHQFDPIIASVFIYE